VSANVKPLVAYSVQADECGTIRFARSGAAARREGADELDVEWEHILFCRRAPQFDCYADTRIVPEEALWKSGWRFLCCRCDAQVCDDSLGQMIDGRAYCEDHAPLQPNGSE
jgi:hypothetical protein